MSGTPPPDDLRSRAARALNDAVQTLNDATQTVSDIDDRTIGRDRSLIVRVVLIVFVIAVFLAVFGLFFSPVVTNEWEKLNAQILDLLKSIVLPLVTLVFGYYFGKSEK